jgi:two-component system chemotaxis response regulator CheY
MRALVVEDDFTSRTLLTKMLGSFFEVDSAVNGQEAVQAYKRAMQEERPYDVMFMDIMMPEMDGISALERIQELNGESGLEPSKVIMTTALDDMKTVIRAFHDGWASAYIVKPVDKTKLYAELEKLGFIGE